MGFTAATIVAPDVPAGLDPLRYLTMPPQSKLQEQAQARAQALAVAKLRGIPMPDFEAALAADESGLSQKMSFKPLTPEEEQAVQDAKSSVLAYAEPPAPGITPTNPVEYPFLANQSRAAQLAQHYSPSFPTSPPRSTSRISLRRPESVYGTHTAPVVELHPDTFYESLPMDLISEIAEQYSGSDGGRPPGLVKIVPPPEWRLPGLPLSADHSMFRASRQLVTSQDESPTFEDLRRGFIRAAMHLSAQESAVGGSTSESSQTANSAAASTGATSTGDPAPPAGSGLAQKQTSRSTATASKTSARQPRRRGRGIMVFDHRPLDLYRLFRAVRSRGGGAAVSKRKEWAQVGRELGYSSQVLPTLSSAMRQAYARHIQPFEEFLEQHGVELFAHAETMFDVDVKNRKNWPIKLPFGIVAKPPGEPTSMGQRQILNVSETRRPATSSIKNFRQKSLNMSGVTTIPVASSSSNVQPPLKDSPIAAHPKSSSPATPVPIRVLQDSPFSEKAVPADTRTQSPPNAPIPAPRSTQGTTPLTVSSATPLAGQEGLDGGEALTSEVAAAEAILGSPVAAPMLTTPVGSPTLVSATAATLTSGTFSNNPPSSAAVKSISPSTFSPSSKGMPLPTSQDLTDTEKEYLSLPSGSEAERLEPLRLRPYPAAFSTAEDRATPYDAWDFLGLAFRGNSFASYVSDDVDHLVFPRISAGSRFATEDWYMTSDGTIEVSYIMEGGPRTWYTSDGTWVDQMEGEIVLVFPGVRVMNWCHAFCVHTAVNVMPKSWALQTSRPGIDTQLDVDCAVYAAAKSPDLTEVMREAVVSALRQMQQRETSAFQSLKDLRHQVISPDAGGTRSHDTGKPLFFSWVVVGKNEIWSPQAFLAEVERPSDARFVSRYKDVSAYFDGLISEADQNASATEKASRMWWSRLEQTLSTRDLPIAADIVSLCESVPKHEIKARLVASQLRESLENMTQWMELAEREVRQLQRIGEASYAYNKMVEMQDAGGKVVSFREKLESSENTRTELYQTVRDLAKSREFDQALAKAREVKSLGPLPKRQEDFVAECEALASWVASVRTALTQQPANLDLLQYYKTIGVRKLGLPSNSVPLKRIDEVLEGNREWDHKLSVFLRSQHSFDPVQIREVQQATSQALVSDLVSAQFRVLVDHLPVIERMSWPEFEQRPRLSEVAALRQFPAGSRAVYELERWLDDAKALDWLAISSALERLAARADPDPQQRLIPTSGIISVWTRMFKLQVVPDDVVSVRQTFESTLRQLMGQPPETLQRYGFIQ